MICCAESLDESMPSQIDDEEVGDRYVGNVKRSSFSNAGTLVVTRRVKKTLEGDYLEWCERIEHALRKQTGFCSVDVYPPVSGGQKFYTHIVKFDTLKDVMDWRHSQTCNDLMNEVSQYTIDVDIHIMRSDHASSLVWGIGTEHSHDDHAHTNEDEKPPQPIPWKQVTAILTCLWPLASLVDFLYYLFFRAVGKPPIPVIALVNIFTCVCLLVFYFVPLYMEHLAWWVFKEHDLVTDLKIIIPTAGMIAAVLLLVIFFRN